MQPRSPPLRAHSTTNMELKWRGLKLSDPVSAWIWARLVFTRSMRSRLSDSSPARICEQSACFYERSDLGMCVCEMGECISGPG